MKKKTRKVKKLKVKVSTKSDKNVEMQPKQEELSEKSVIKLPTLCDLESTVNDTVIGQEQIVKSICTKIYEGICFPNIKNNILIVGKSGTGKTEIVRQIANNLEFPLVVEDATRFTQEGYVGASVDEMIYDMIREANNNISLAQRGIIFVDEIDKKANKYANYSDISKGDVLKSLLKIMEGTKVQIDNPNFWENPAKNELRISFDTSNLIFIFGGAFEGIDKIRDKRLKQSSGIGFSSIEEKAIVINNNSFKSFTKEDLIEYGMPTEFIGRITNIYETNNLDESNLVKILANSKGSIFKKYEAIFKAADIQLEYPKTLFLDIAQKAKMYPTGARELNSQVSYIFEGIIYDLLNNKKDYKKCVLEEGILNDNKKYHWET
mgnify:FL=1